MLKGYKYAIFPTDVQKEQLNRFFGCCRFVHNLAIEVKKQTWAIANKNLTWVELICQVKELKDTDAPWLRDCPAQALQMVVINLDKNYNQFFKGGGYPRFKSKRNRQSIHFPQGVKTNYNNGTIFIPKLKDVKCIFHRKFSGEIKTVTISMSVTGKYFASVLVDDQNQLPAKKPIANQTAIGVDLGVKTFATLSNGAIFENPKHLKSQLKKLRVQKRKLSRRFVDGRQSQSNSYLKQKIIVAKIHEKIKNKREDYLHKVSRQIIDGHDTICVESLNIKGMTGNRSLSLAISEIGWYRFKTMLIYKAEWAGKNIISIGTFEPSSKMCSECGLLFKKLTLDHRKWTCDGCGAIHDRDINAAINIKEIGLGNKPSTANVSHEAVRMG